MTGWVLDVERGDWLEVPELPESTQDTWGRVIGIPGDVEVRLRSSAKRGARAAGGTL